MTATILRLLALRKTIFFTYFLFGHLLWQEVQVGTNERTNSKMQVKMDRPYLKETNILYYMSDFDLELTREVGERIP